MRRIGVAVIVALAAALITPTSAGAATGVQVATITGDGGGTCTYSGAVPSITVTAPSTGCENREAFFVSTAAAVLNSESCATWSAESGQLVQQGATFRLTQTNSVLRAITVTKNIFSGDPNDNGQWSFNVNLWDTSKSPSLTNLKTGMRVPMLQRSPGVVALPWHFCARVKNRNVQFRVWLDGQTKPAYGKKGVTGRARLPKGWAIPGRTGWYIGHLAPGDSASYRDMATTNL